MDLELITHVSRLEELEVDWWRLLERSHANVPMLSPLWVLSWWRVFGAPMERDLRVAALWQNNELVGLAPLMVSRVRPSRLMPQPLSRLCLIGTEGDHPRSVSSEYNGILVAPGYEHRACQLLARQIADQKLGTWDEVVLTRFQSSDPTAALLAAELTPSHGSSAVTATCCHATLGQSYEQYLEALPAQGRQLLSRSVSEFETWAAGTAKFEVASNVDELEAARRVLVRLHAERWGTTPTAWLFDSVRPRAFHDALLSQLFERNALELCWLSVKDEPVAIAFNIVWNGRVMFHQGGRSRTVPAGVRPGIALHARAIQRAIELGRSEYDFLSSGSRYQRDLSLGFRPVATIHATRQSWRTRLNTLLSRGSILNRPAKPISL